MGPGVNNVFQINLGPLGFKRLGLNQTSCMEPFYVFFSFAFHVFKQVPISISCLGECYNIVVAVKLQKCFVCYEAFTQQMKLNIVFLTLNVNSHFLLLLPDLFLHYFLLLQPPSLALNTLPFFGVHLSRFRVVHLSEQRTGEKVGGTVNGAAQNTREEPTNLSELDKAGGENRLFKLSMANYKCLPTAFLLPLQECY